ncbi:MAG: hypothetical protein AAF352_00915 [Pseudomonadota bacterium]
MSDSDDLDFQKAPEPNLQTWNRVIKLFAWVGAGVTIVLLLMGGFLVG